MMCRDILQADFSWHIEWQARGLPHVHFFPMSQAVWPLERRIALLGAASAAAILTAQQVVINQPIFEEVD